MEYKLLKEAALREMMEDDEENYVGTNRFPANRLMSDEDINAQHNKPVLNLPKPPDGTSKETCSFRDFKRFAKSLGYKITSSVTDFGGFGYGSARFYKVFQGDRKIVPLDPRKKDEYVKGWWDKAISMDREFQEFVLSHKIIDDDGRKCIPNPS